MGTYGMARARRAAQRCSALFGLGFALTAVITAVVLEARAAVLPLAAPTGVAARAADRRLTVSWNPTADATAYRVAVRPADGLISLAWREYTTASSPHTIADIWAMSGLSYEVRVASVNADDQSAWSPVVTLTAPALEPAPAGAIAPSLASSPYRVWDAVQLSLRPQQPFENHSPWRWSVCGADGSDCRLLPLASSATHAYLIGREAQGKRLRAQVDYDKDGVSYTAATLSEIIQAPLTVAPSDLPAPPPAFETHLYALHSTEVGMEPISGGALAPLADDLLFVGPYGRIARVRPPGNLQPASVEYLEGDASVEYLEGRVPMNRDRAEAHWDRLQARLDPSHPDFRHFRSVFGGSRVADILLKEGSDGRHRLFVTHHHFTEECVRFRLSSTDVVLREGSVSLAPAWRTVFDAEPCIPGSTMHQAGGRMVADGPEHLLVVIGDHGSEDLAQAVDSHLGKLVRIEIETGDVETVASGLRNPQGLVRGADGILWATDHGPQGGDELNILRPGENYGWPLVTLGVGYGGVVRNDPLSVGSHGGFAEPVFSWVPSVGISSIAVNDEQRLPLWKDDLLVASLDGESLFRVRLHDQDVQYVQYVEEIEVGFRIRDLAQLPDGRIALLNHQDSVHFLSRSYWHCGNTDRESRRLGKGLRHPGSVYAIDCDLPLLPSTPEPPSESRP